MSNVYTFSGGTVTEGIPVILQNDGYRAVRVGSLKRGQGIPLGEGIVCAECPSGKVLLKKGVVERVSGRTQFVPLGEQPAPHSYLLIETSLSGIAQNQKLRRSGEWFPLGVNSRADSTVQELLRAESPQTNAPQFLLRMQEGDSVAIRPFGVSPQDKSNTFVVSCYRKPDSSLGIRCESMQTILKRSEQQN